MAETLWVAGNRSRAVLALADGAALSDLQALDGLSLDSGTRLQQLLTVVEYHSPQDLFSGLTAALPVFESGIGALLMLFSVILSRTLARTQGDRDDPEPPLVTKPFGHASQEIVNLLLCGHAVANVFDGVMDLGGGMALQGIPGEVEVGFLTLLESLNLCKVGHHLKSPRLPIWVVGSESHYTVLFALERSVQEDEDSPLEREERRVKKVFDDLDTSGGGGFIPPESFDRLCVELGLDFPPAVKEDLRSVGVVVWQELWPAVLRLDTDKGGLKHLAAAAQGAAAQESKRFTLFHFNGIAKRVSSSSAQAPSADMDESSRHTQGQERPRLTKLWVSVPPRWSPNDNMAIQPYTNLSMAPGDAGDSTATSNQFLEDAADSTIQSMFDKVQHAPLADCIRTRWPRATCGWDGDPPSIV